MPVWGKGWRERIWPYIDGPWDLVIIGGGITGAGILREASRAGLRALLIEANDFASGTSSRSSKLVHGGFRYLENAQVKLTLESVRERERLLREGRGLVAPLGFLLASYRGEWPSPWVFGAGLMIYDLLAMKWNHRYYDARGLHELCPFLRQENLLGGYRFFDAQTDDARLVLRVIREAVAAGGVALDYARASDLLRTRDGRVSGVVVSDLSPEGCGRICEVQAPVVINATGAWADELRQRVGGKPRLRRLRGSHLVFPAERLRLSRAVSLLHPWDQRHVFIFPWENLTLVGTTDVDHTGPLDQEPAISGDESEYLLAATRHAFPGLDLTFQDVQAVFSGVRPVINTGKANPSKESREHILWDEQGLLSVSGGKLTTFRLMAHDVLQAAAARLPGRPRIDPRQPILDSIPTESLSHSIEMETLAPVQRLRLLGRYGADAPELLASAAPGELAPIDDTPCLWAELRWAARSEGVVHLDDLLLRRVRLGLLLPHGGLALMDSIRAIAQPELGWDDSRWEQEERRYAHLWRHGYELHP